MGVKLISIGRVALGNHMCEQFRVTRSGTIVGTATLDKGVYSFGTFTGSRARLIDHVQQGAR